MDWTQIGLYAVPLILVLIGGLIWLFLRRTIRTRLAMDRQLQKDPQINDWLVVFSWTRKVLYIPTIIVSLMAALFMLLKQSGLPFRDGFEYVVGGVWLGVFFINFLIDEYEMSLRVLLMVILAVAVLVLWLTLVGWLDGFLQLFTHLKVSISAMGYLAFALIFLLAIGISWIRGLFFYVALTPNFLAIQSGPNETGEQVSREAFSTRIDTGDFLERVFGFGQIIITFADTRRQPLVLLVGQIDKRAAKLETIRGHLAVETVSSVQNLDTRPQ